MSAYPTHRKFGRLSQARANAIIAVGALYPEILGARNLRNLRNYTVKLADVGCTKPKIDNKTACFYLTMTYSKDK